MTRPPLDDRAFGPRASSIDDPPGQAWRRAIDYGFDDTLLDHLLTLTPYERLVRHDQALELVRALRAAGQAYYGFDPRHPETPRGGEG